jgi:hypothetical protein
MEGLVVCDTLFWEKIEKFVALLQKDKSLAESCFDLYAKNKDKTQFLLLSYEYFEKI